MLLVVVVLTLRSGDGRSSDISCVGKNLVLLLVVAFLVLLVEDKAKFKAKR